MGDETRRARSLLGMPVYSLAEGRRIGEVDALFIRPAERALGALRIAGDGHHRTLPFELVASIGADAVTVEREEMLQGGLPSPALRALDTHLSGRRVLTESGEVVGAIAGYLVNIRTGKIESFRVRCESGMLGRLTAMLRDDALEIPDELVVSLGENALIVRDEALSHSRPAAPHEEHVEVTEVEDAGAVA